MTFEEFVFEVNSRIGFKFLSQGGASNIARPMDGYIFLGGPNIRSKDGTKPYEFHSQIFFSAHTQLFFCLNFGNKTKDLLEAREKLPDPTKSNNCKVLMD